MRIAIANETGDIVHVAIYMKSLIRPTRPTIVWTILSPPPRGRAIFSIPRDYRVLVRYSFSAKDLLQPVYQTNTLTLRRSCDSVAVREIRQGRLALGAVLSRNSREPGVGGLRIQNEFSVPVWCHFQLGESDLCLPQLLAPRETLHESLDSPFFLSVVNPFIAVGAALQEQGMQAIELKAGEDGSFSVSGTPALGYRVRVGAEHPDERRPESSETRGPVDSKRQPKRRRAATAPRIRPPKAKRHADGEAAMRAERKPKQDEGPLPKRAAGSDPGRRRRAANRKNSEQERHLSGSEPDRQTSHPM